jgi:cathepsin X
MSDRIKIMRKAAWPDINIAPQVLISCEMTDNGCHGGNPISALHYIKAENITDETCAIYTAAGHTQGNACSPIMKCRNCDPKKPCFIPDQYATYTVEEYGGVYGEMAMMEEIYKNGPIACGIAATPDFENNYKGGIYKDTSGAMQTDHDISIVGFGVSPEGEKFWEIRNSWGTHWGEEGFFKLVRGVNNMAIESNCTWATPMDTWSTPKDHMHVTTVDEKGFEGNNFTNKAYPVGPPHLAEPKEKFLEETPAIFTKGCRNPVSVWATAPPAIPAADQTLLDWWSKNLPKTLDWRNNNGTNFLSWTKNQHIPYYCGSCWAQGTTSALADRFNVMEIWKNKKVPTSPIALSAQVIVDCSHGEFNYGCNGGDPYAAMEYIYANGVTHASCEQYTAQNAIAHEDSCTDKRFICRDCSPNKVAPFIPIDMGSQYFENCYEPETYTTYHVSTYGNSTTEMEMKTQLAAYGPIGCGIQADSKLENEYTGGIFKSDLTATPVINHEVSVVGWGHEDSSNQDYWIVRNSWGTYWGEHGFFQLLMSDDPKTNLGIQTTCTWGIPTYDAPKMANVEPIILAE